MIVIIQGLDNYAVFVMSPQVAVRMIHCTLGMILYVKNVITNLAVNIIFIGRNTMIKEFQKEYRWLSNFAPVMIEDGEFTFRSVEHAYMAAKSDSPLWKRFCMVTESPGEVKKASRKIKLTHNWHKNKIEIMKAFLIQKYNQEPYKTKLINTGNQRIQEGNYWGDKFWGVCLKTDTGQDILGKSIMEIRDGLNTRT